MILYKYGGDSGLRILEDLRLKITPPNEFNDPFEITPNTKRARALQEMTAAAKLDSQYFRDVYDDMIHAEEYVGTFEKFIKELPTALQMHYSPYKKSSRREMIKRDMSAVDDSSAHLGVLCLSQPPNNIPMWSYYGNNHRGVVFGIKIDDICGARLGWKGAVKYRKHRVKLNPFTPHHSAASQRERVLFTKSQEWKHEREHRHVFRLCDLSSPRSAAGEPRRYFLDISGSSIMEIIFGCRVKPELEQKIREELHRKPRTFGHVRLFRCERHISQFELKIIPA